jgi:glycosyltransferase involved in cell wall biosynthesis
MNNIDITVSIIIPTFNRTDYLRQTLESIRRQTYTKWEAILVDDGSSEQTLNLLAEYQKLDTRFRSLKRNRLPKGASTCRNIGLCEARGTYVIFLDSDDQLSPSCIFERMAVAEKNFGADALVFQALWFREAYDDLRLLMNRETEEQNLLRFLRGDAVWTTGSTLWKKESVLGLGGFDERLSCWQDIEIHQRALLNKLSIVSQLSDPPDWYLRQHDDESISQQGFKTSETVHSIFLVYEKAVKCLRPNLEGALKENIRKMLAHGFQHALDGRYFSLASMFVSTGRRDRVLDFKISVVWRLAYYGYFIHGKGIRGAARFAKRLLRPYQPNFTIRTERYNGPVSGFDNLDQMWGEN